MERTKELKRLKMEDLECEVLEDIILELEAKGVAISEQDIIEEHEYQAHELEMEEAMIDEMVENDMS